MRASRTLVIAEAGVNHNGDTELAKRLIEAAAHAGADVVKFQTFRADMLVSGDAPKAAYQLQGTDHAESQLDMLRRLELGLEDHIKLMRHCEANRIRFLSTPFDLYSIGLLHRLGVTTGKVPSGEITNRPYLEEMAVSFPDLIVSTGMCTIEEVGEALDVLYERGASRENVVLLHCNTEYPTPFCDVNLLAMRSLSERFGVRVGYSDHTTGIEVPIAAAALGACVIEKHFTLDRDMVGPDHRASIEPEELRAMVLAIRHIEEALGDGEKKPMPSETKNMIVARKSIVLARDISAGETVSMEDLDAKRPGDGISPMRIREVAGRIVLRDLSAGHRLAWNDLS